MSDFDEEEEQDTDHRWAHEPRAGNDSPPLFASVRDQPYSRGSLTSQARTTSPAYIQFLQRLKEDRSGRK